VDCYSSIGLSIIPLTQSQILNGDTTEKESKDKQMAIDPFDKTIVDEKIAKFTTEYQEKGLFLCTKL
jgi:hypothetical protein